MKLTFKPSVVYDNATRALKHYQSEVVRIKAESVERLSKKPAGIFSFGKPMGLDKARKIIDGEWSVAYGAKLAVEELKEIIRLTDASDALTVTLTAREANWVQMNYGSN